MKKCDFSEIYQEYNNVIKPLIAKIEATQECLPIQILNELRAVNDHIARCHLSNADEDFINRQKERIQSHHLRIILDCLKMINVHYHAEMRSVEKSTNIEMIDSGKFYIQYSTLSKEAIDLTFKAKIEENKNKEKAIFIFQEATAKYEEISTLIRSNYAQIKWAKTYNNICWLDNICHYRCLSFKISLTKAFSLC